jgi:hypothetical protein
MDSTVPSLLTVLAQVPDPRQARPAPSLGGEMVTLDAEFTRWLVAQHVGARGGASLLVVKAEQPPLLRIGAAATADQSRRPRPWLGQTQTGRLARGRPEARPLRAVAAPPDLVFPFVRQVLRLHRRRVDKRTGAGLTGETVAAVTSLGPEHASPRQLLHLWPRHWWIENRARWVRCGTWSAARTPAPPPAGPPRRPSPPCVTSPAHCCTAGGTAPSPPGARTTPASRPLSSGASNSLPTDFEMALLGRGAGDQSLTDGNPHRNPIPVQ